MEMANADAFSHCV